MFRWFAAVLVVFATAMSAAAASPKPSIAGYIAGLTGEIRSMLKAGDVKRANGIFAERFDMSKFGERCLADHWDELTPDERRRFTNLLEKNLRYRMSEKMLFTEQDKNFSLRINQIRREQAQLIRIKNELGIRRGNFELVLILTPQTGSYRIADIEIEGVLLSRNYRGQFNHLIRKYGKEGMFARMEDTLARKAP